MTAPDLLQPLAVLLGAVGMDALARTMGALIVWLAVTLVTLGFSAAIAYLDYYLLTLPLRRRERARVFLDVLETGLREGRSVEHTLVSLSRQGVRDLGPRLGPVARALEGGSTLAEALGKVPGFLPTPLPATLAVGERVGDIAQVLPACRRTLGDALARTRGAMNYLVLILFGLTQAGVLLLIMLGVGVYIIPRFEAMMDDLGVAGLPATVLLFYRTPLGHLVLTGVAALVALAAAFYIGGPWLVAALHLRRAASWVQCLLPWRRKRLQRDCSAMLGVLLDAGVPEAEALTLAATSTGNTVLAARAEAAAAALSQGATLAEAVARLDRSGELRWRLANAAHVGAGFRRSLAGWHESLEAKAFQQEQAAAHAVTTAVVLFNGLMVAALVIGLFQCLLHLINEAGMW